MEKMIKLVLSDLDVGQILDGLEQRRIVWQATAEYLEMGYTDLSDCIEECSKEYEAQVIADYYEKIINTIKKQRDLQMR